MRHLEKWKFCFLLLMSVLTTVAANAQNTPLKGHVADKNGAAIAGAAVSVKGKSGTTAVADANGRFTVKASVGDVLVFTAVNFKITEKKITSESAALNVIMDDEVSLMEEVIVTAGGVKAKRKEVGTATTVVNADVLNKGMSTTVAGGLQGKVAGLMINNASGGLNPSYSVVLRGQRSLTGNNQALIVLDNVIVPSSMLSNINPQDIENVTVLNGAGAAALYGSSASNGAMIVTTKKGKAGVTQVRVSNTVTAEHVAFFPKLQTEFGSGGTAYGYDSNGQPLFSDIENQSYGPRYDGSIKNLGAPLEDGSQLTAVYANNDSRKKFWNTGISDQTDFSVTSGDNVSTFFVAGQYLTSTGTTPGDKYNRTEIRLNGTRKIGKTINVTYSTSYTQNRYDITSQTSSVYTNLLNIPSWIPVLRFKNWQTDKFANPNGYYNPWYQNPYFTIDNNRSVQRNDYLTGNVEVKYTPLTGLDFVARQGIATRNYSNKNTVGAFDYTTYAETVSGSKTDIAASVSDGSNYTTELVSDLYAQYNHKLGTDFDLHALAGMQWRQDQAKYVNVSSAGLVIPDFYNINAGVGSVSAGESDYKARQMGALAEVRLGYKGYLYLHGTGRNDWVSTLAPENRSFFYPSADLSFIASDAIDVIRQSKVISYLKLRGGWSKVGQVNLGVAGTDFGAYYLQNTYSQASGFPYGNLAGYTVGNNLVTPSLKPEISKTYEFGADFNLFKDRITANLTWYSTKTDNQTVNTYISSGSGYTRLLLNSGTTTSRGLEASLHGTVIRHRDLQVNIGGNYTYLHNVVNNINASLPNLPLAQYSDNSGSYAVAGQAFPVIMGYDYIRDPQGHVIVDATTGNPTKDQNIKVLGNAMPKHRLGLDASVNYKNFKFSILFEYRGGYKIYNGIGSELDWSGTGARTVAYDRQRFVFPNSVIADPAHPGSYIKNTSVLVQDGNGNAGFWTDDNLNRGVTSNYVTSGAFWKLREASISYTLPASLLANMNFIKSVTVSVQGRNLFLWLAKDNLYTDPEYSDAGSTSNGIGLNGTGQTPPSRYFGGTLSVNF